MNRFAWVAKFVFLGTVAAVESACTVVLNGGSDDAGLPLTDDSSTASSDGAGSTDALPDTSSEAADVFGGCSVGIETMVPACNQCIESMCCASWVTCTTADDAGVDDGGRSQCAQLTQCVLDWVAGGDSGSLSSGEAVCGGSYTQSERDTSHAFLSCMQNSCPTQCH